VQRNLDRGCHDACQELIETAAARWQEEEGDYRDDVRSPPPALSCGRVCINCTVFMLDAVSRCILCGYGGLAGQYCAVRCKLNASPR
jgi:hypothetical protein